MQNAQKTELNVTELEQGYTVTALLVTFYQHQLGLEQDTLPMWLIFSFYTHSICLH